MKHNSNKESFDSHEQCSTLHEQKHNLAENPCNCGYDHNHNHLTEYNACDCGHNHSHNHLTENNACDCGHGHDHNHSHHSEGSSCGCGHDHGAPSKYTNFEIIGGALLFIIGILTTKLTANEMLSAVIFLAAYTILGYHVIITAIKNIFKGDFFDENFLMAVASIGALILSDFPEAVAVMLFYRVGEWFEEKAVAKSRKQIMDAVDLRPEVVHLVAGDTSTEIPASNAKIDDIILIRPGDRIPLDGVIFDGETRIDTSAITGEPVPVSAKQGDAIISGCINLSGVIKVKVEKELKDSMVSRILDSVEDAAASKPKIEHFITKFARIYTPIVLLLAILTAIIPSLITGNWSHWVYIALTFLVISCPCALVLSVPLAYFAGIGAGSKKNILFKSGSTLELLAHINAVIVDKTGTITKGDFSLQKVVSPNMDSNELLRIAASIESNSTHPIAQSIVVAATERNLTLDLPTTLEEIAGHGIIATLSQGTILCGNEKLLMKYQVAVPTISNTQGSTIVYLAINQVYAGCLIISDTIKSDAKKSISDLNTMHMHTVMLTGDDITSATAIAQEVGIQDVYGKLLPVEKLERLQNIRRTHGKTLFVGDGINDAPVLAGADVGAAMGSGADAAIEAADVIYLTSNTSAIVDSIKIAKTTNIISKQNVIFALGIKLLVMILGLFGFASMWLAVFADTGVALLCVLNSVRILYKK